jgi:hypothetical protein
MKNKIPTLITAVSILIAIAGITSGVKANQAKKTAQQEAAELREKLNSRPTTGKKSTTSNATSAGDIAALKKLIAERDAELARLRSAKEGQQDETRENRRQTFQDRMAQLKEEDPEKYEQMMQERTERQTERRTSEANRLASLLDMDTSRMTEEQLANHNALMDKMAALWEVSNSDSENPPDREAMRELTSGISEMMDVERSYMFEQLGAEVGLSSSESSDFSAYVESIIDATTMQSPRGGGGGGGRGR